MRQYLYRVTLEQLTDSHHGVPAVVNVLPAVRGWGIMTTSFCRDGFAAEADFM